MGFRLYNPATGRFLSADPIPGGNDNPYVYPANPIDSTDPLGTRAAPVGSDPDRCTCTAYNQRWRPIGLSWTVTGSWKTMVSNSTWWGRALVMAGQLYTGIIAVQSVAVQFRSTYRVYRACIDGDYQYSVVWEHLDDRMRATVSVGIPGTGRFGRYLKFLTCFGIPS